MVSSKFYAGGAFGQAFTTGRAYNLAGSVTSQTYPSGHIVAYGYDTAGRTNSFTGNLGNGVNRTYASGILYAALGGMTKEQFGTDSAVYHKRKYNIRGQLYDVRASNVNDEMGGELGALVNYYSTLWQHGGSGPDNNGNVLMSQTIINSYMMEDRYSYDSLNRLTSVEEWQNGASLVATTYATGDKLRVAVEGGVVKYRKNGTLIYTNTVAPTYPLLVDTSLYTDGSTISEVVLSGIWGGSSGSSTANISWLVSDHLGTPRMIIDKSGTLAGIKRHDYLPFGEELFGGPPGNPGAGGRLTTQGYSGDSIRQKFTSKERDIESGLDYSINRYYSNVQGRFTSVDEFWKDSHLGDPQSWNKYAYVRGNPLALVDPSGEKAKVTVTVDKKNKTGSIEIEASFAIYAADGQGVTNEQLNDQAKLIKNQIESTYAGSFTAKDGITYTVSASATVQVVGSEKEAVAGGNMGTFDNIVEIGSKNLMDAGTKPPGSEGASYHLRRERFDRVKAEVGVDPTSNLYGHEFSHLLGSRSHQSKFIGSGDVSSSDNPTPLQITKGDFSHLFARQIGIAARRTKPTVERRQAPTVGRRRIYWK